MKYEQSLKYVVSDPHDIDLHQVWQAEEEEERREKTGREREWFPGVGSRVLQVSTAMDYDQQRHKSGPRWDIIAYGSTAELLAQALAKRLKTKMEFQVRCGHLQDLLQFSTFED